MAPVSTDGIAERVRAAGVAGAGGAGFPAYAKWERAADLRCLLVNHQESEPTTYKDKWLGRTAADDFAALLAALTDGPLEAAVVGAKARNRDPWCLPLEAALAPAVYEPGDLPLDAASLDGTAMAYTGDRYEYGMESVLLRTVAGVTLGRSLPADHGWVVHNTETLHNVYRALASGAPVTRKLVHVDGVTPRHRFLDVPVGTPLAAVLAAAGVDELPDDAVLADGGPGWATPVHGDPATLGVTKRTTEVLLLPADVAAAHTLGGRRIDVREAMDWGRDHETEPVRLEPDRVCVPLVSNPDLAPLVRPSVPTVSEGDPVDAGDRVADPATTGFSNPQHASVDGRVTAVTDTHVAIRAS